MLALHRAEEKLRVKGALAGACMALVASTPFWCETGLFDTHPSNPSGQSTKKIRSSTVATGFFHDCTRSGAS